MQYRAQNMLITRVWILVDYLPVILIVSQQWSKINCQDPDFDILTDRSVRVQRGLCVHVPCSFTVPSHITLSRNTNGFWSIAQGQTRVTVASRVNSVYNTNGRFHLIGDVTRGDCSYYIEAPLSTDKGSYYFRIEDPQIQFNYPNILPYVSVTALTDKPTISSMRLVDGKEVMMTCKSPGRCRNITQPHISWEGAMTDTRQMIYTTTYEDGTRTFHSNITFTLRKSHNNSPLSCKVRFTQDSSTTEKQILNVEYSPSININIEGVDTNDTTSVIVEDGDSVTLQCIVDSNPNASITWYKEDIVLHRNISDQIVTIQLINITESDAGRYQCSAMNEHGVTNRSVHIMYQNQSGAYLNSRHFGPQVLSLHLPSNAFFDSTSRGNFSFTLLMGRSYTGAGRSQQFVQLHSNASYKGTKYIVLLPTIGAICLLLLVLIAYACWRKRQNNSRSAETEDTYTDLRRSEITDTYDQLKIEDTYTDLIRSEITDTYDQLKPVTRADTDVVGSDVGAANDYENVNKQ